MQAVGNSEDMKTELNTVLGTAELSQKLESELKAYAQNWEEHRLQTKEAYYILEKLKGYQETYRAGVYAVAAQFALLREGKW